MPERFWIGETKPIRIDLTDEDGAALDITGWQDFVVAIGQVVTSSAYKEWADNAAVPTGEITVNASPPYLEVSFTQSESNGLSEATYKLDVFMQLGDVWIHNEALKEIEVRDPVATLPTP